MIAVLKLVVVLTWLFLGSCFFVGSESTWAWFGRLGFWAMLFAHVVEFAIYLPRLRSAPGPLAAHFLMVLVFGLFHVRELEEGEAPAG